MYWAREIRGTMSNDTMVTFRSFSTLTTSLASKGDRKDKCSDPSGTA